MPKLGEVLEVTKKNGNTVKRKCVAVIDAKYMEEAEQLTVQNKFVPMFVQKGYVYMSLTAPNRKKLTPQEIAKRKADAQKKHDDFVKRVADNKVTRENKKKTKHANAVANKKKNLVASLVKKGVSTIEAQKVADKKYVE